MLYEEVVEVDGRVIPKRDDCHFKTNWNIVKGTTGEELYEIEAINEENVRSSLTVLQEKGISSIAVALMHC